MRSGSFWESPEAMSHGSKKGRWRSCAGAFPNTVWENENKLSSGETISGAAASNECKVRRKTVPDADFLRRKMIARVKIQEEICWT